MHVHTADSIWAFELGHRAAEIAERLGVPKVTLRAGPAARSADPSARVASRRPRADRRTPSAPRAIASRSSDEDLRESVQKAVSLALARERGDRPI